MAGTNSTQSAVAALLADPATHGLDQGAVKRIDTHAAMVFLAGTRVYKVKRAVRYPYLDFSTLTKREAACRAEIAANRPFASELYEGVIPIVRRPDGRLALTGEGETVEWVVVMRRFDENSTLDHVAAREGIGDELARRLGEAVAAAHGRAPVVEASPWIEALGRYVEDEATGIRAVPDIVPATEAAALERALRERLGRIRPLLARRGQAGLVRRGHGDLHLGNVALIEDKPVPFDALEFDPVVASGDLLYDLAFLLMDLLARKLDRAANIVFNRYLVAAGRDDDLNALAALPFFMGLRAAIRGRVALDRRKLVQGDAQREAEAEARSYVALAARLLSPPPPRLVAIGGLSGTGKSLLGAALAPLFAPAPGAVHLRSDIERKRLHGAGEFERLPPQAYGAEATERVYARLAALAKRAVEAGHSAVVDAVYAEPGERAAIERMAAAAKVDFHGIWLDADLQSRVARVGARRADASDADAEIARAQESYDPGEIRWHRVDAVGNPAEILQAARRAL
ncbi:MAG: AAA family ATPase [Xanthobacteraceae bacterium]|nr:AAA family ATPase [Xanthobacteraceae bacterium]